MPVPGGRVTILDEWIEIRARALHDRYRALYPALPVWEVLPESKREVNRAQVREFDGLARRCGCDDLEALAAGAHNVWARFCEDRGDPRLVHYADLPESEKQKDREIIGFLREIYHN